MAQDARHTVRLWIRRPWHTAFAILALAIGIGAGTGVFSVVNALLLRSLPFHDPERLAYLSNIFAPHDSAAQFHQWRRQSPYLADTALFEPFDVNLGGAGEWRRAHVAQVSSNFFSVLGTQPVLGHGFTAGDDVDARGWGSPGRNAVAVIGYGLWQALFGGDPKALGATIRLDGIPLTVVGVAPSEFDYPGKAGLWKPAAFSPGNNGWEVVARLKPAIPWPQARQAFSAEADRLWPGRTALQKIQSPSQLTALRDQLAGPTKQASLVLLASVALILLLACTNVANLLLARTADRAAELSIRSALGASRARLSRQLLTECVLLALAASLAGIFVALWTTSIAAKVQPAPIASQSYSVLDGRVLGFAIAISVPSGLLFGVLPSLFAGRVHTFAARGSSDTRAAWLVREALVAAQVVLAVVLPASSLSVGRAFLHMMRIDRGFPPKGRRFLCGCPANTRNGRAHGAWHHAGRTAGEPLARRSTDGRCRSRGGSGRSGAQRRFLQSLIEGAQPDSAAIYAGTLLSIALIAAAGIWVATRPLARPDIVEILRAELPRATPGGGERRRRPNQQLEAERLRTAPVPPTCTP
ncbi:MAG TPA: ABC transporter permease [Candidatus Acidoferrales bacterium]|nr:ABC transporter permease [Candidatus Acidoferrales bacterium]